MKFFQLNEVLIGLYFNNWNDDDCENGNNVNYASSTMFRHSPCALRSEFHVFTTIHKANIIISTFLMWKWKLTILNKSSKAT